MPWLLSWYILRDLLRTFLLTAAVLATVVAFGAAIKPLSDDKLLGAVQALRYVGLAMVPMLQFAIPASAGFAATLLAHRMTVDNEVLAISAGGISYRRILIPIAALGVVLLVIMLWLTQWTIPRFWGLMRQTITADITRLFESSIARGEPFGFGQLQIYADEMAVQENPPDSDADARMVLLRVVAAELDREQRIITDVSAGRAEVYVYRRQEGTYLKLVMTDTVVFNGSTGQLAHTDEVRPSRAIRIANLLEDDPRTMTRTQLRGLLRDTDHFSDVVDRRENLYAAMRNARAFSWLDERLQRLGEVELERAGPEPRSYRVVADRLDDRLLSRENGAPVEVQERRADGTVRTFVATRASLGRTVTSRLADPRFELTLVDCEVRDETGGREANRRARIDVPDLVVPVGRDDGLEDLPSEALLARARATAGDDREVKRRIGHLIEELDEVRNEVVGRLQNRYALSMTAPLLLLLGATLAMWLRESLPLTIYLWAFIPTILDLILISGGEQMLHDGRSVGYLVLWSGNAALLALLLFSYMRLSRH